MHSSWSSSISPWVLDPSSDSCCSSGSCSSSSTCCSSVCYASSTECCSPDSRPVAANCILYWLMSSCTLSLLSEVLSMAYRFRDADTAHPDLVLNQIVLPLLCNFAIRFSVLPRSCHARTRVICIATIAYS